MLSDFPITSICLMSGPGSAGRACVYLETPDILEDWDKDRRFMLRGHRIPVCPSYTDMMLCVARLPTDMSKASFLEMAERFGEVERCFIMISAKTGESKGYGFIRYKNNDVAYAARTKFKEMKIDDQNLWAEFIDTNMTTLESLHSKCLYVTNLPDKFSDNAEFRRRFSEIANPPYCLIAMKNGLPLNWGLVEFLDADEAEATLNKLNGELLDGKPMKITYSIPGVRAINLHPKLIVEADEVKSNGEALLPNPPPEALLENFHSLRRMPAFGQIFETIVAAQRRGNNVLLPKRKNSRDSRDTLSFPVTGSEGGRNKSVPSRTPSPRVTPSPDGVTDSSLLFHLQQLEHLLKNVPPHHPHVLALLEQHRNGLNGGVTPEPEIHSAPHPVAIPPVHLLHHQDLTPQLSPSQIPVSPYVQYAPFAPETLPPVIHPQAASYVLPPEVSIKSASMAALQPPNWIGYDGRAAVNLFVSPLNSVPPPVKANPIPLTNGTVHLANASRAANNYSLLNSGNMLLPCTSIPVSGTTNNQSQWLNSDLKISREEIPSQEKTRKTNYPPSNHSNWLNQFGTASKNANSNYQNIIHEAYSKVLEEKQANIIGPVISNNFQNESLLPMSTHVLSSNGGPANIWGPAANPKPAGAYNIPPIGSEIRMLKKAAAAASFKPMGVSPPRPWTSSVKPSSNISPPTSNKRKHCGLFPSPETSPESYVGQHSQGVGGRYADSSKRKRK